MRKHITFIHTADLHIGAPFKGLRALSDTWAKRLLSAIIESYERVIDTAINEQVDFVIMAGDIFDTTRTSYADYLKFFDGLKRLDTAGIAVYLCTGNHDPYTSWQQDLIAFPANTTMLPANKPGFVIFEKEGQPLVTICGRGFYNQSWPLDENIAKGITRKEAERSTGVITPFYIGVTHTGLNLDPKMSPTDPAELLKAGMDYWALGHIHIKYFYPESNPKLVFPGCIQGRDVNETGERGILKVKMTEGEPHTFDFIPTASVVWQKIEIDIAECGTINEVNEKIMRELFRENSKAHCEEMCVRITLKGKTELHKTLERPGVLDDMRKVINDSYPVFFCDALFDRTVLPIDKEAYKKEGLFPAVYLQVSESFRSDTEEELAYLQEEFLKKGLKPPKISKKKVEALAEESENLVLDLLNGSSI